MAQSVFIFPCECAAQNVDKGLSDFSNTSKHVLLTETVLNRIFMSQTKAFPVMKLFIKLISMYTPQSDKIWPGSSAACFTISHPWLWHTNQEGLLTNYNVHFTNWSKCKRVVKLFTLRGQIASNRILVPTMASSSCICSTSKLYM